MICAVIFSSVLLLASCSSESHLKSVLKSYLPDGLVPTFGETCIKFMGPAEGLFSLPEGSEEIMKQELLEGSVQGSWSRAPSLAEFARRDEDHLGPGVGTTILDGEKCLRKIEREAQEILFGDREGFYFRSDNREVVIVIFDHPSGNGVIFVQAP